MNTPSLDFTLDTPVTRLLDAHQIPYRVLAHSEALFTVAEVAAQRGVRIDEIVKSILLRDKKGKFVMACVTGECRVDPKAVRACMPAEWKRLSFASPEQVLAITGYVKGAVTPLGLPEELPVIFDRAIASRQMVNLSSGNLHAGVELEPGALIRLAGARLADIAK